MNYLRFFLLLAITATAAPKLYKMKGGKRVSFTAQEQAALDGMLASQIIGGPDTVAKGMRELIDSTEADEVMITTRVYDNADRMRSYDLLAEVLENDVEWSESAS